MERERERQRHNRRESVAVQTIAENGKIAVRAKWKMKEK